MRVGRVGSEEVVWACGVSGVVVGGEGVGRVRLGERERWLGRCRGERSGER